MNEENLINELKSDLKGQVYEYWGGWFDALICIEEDELEEFVQFLRSKYEIKLKVESQKQD